MCLNLGAKLAKCCCSNLHTGKLVGAVAVVGRWVEWIVDQDDRGGEGATFGEYDDARATTSATACNLSQAVAVVCLAYTPRMFTHSVR